MRIPFGDPMVDLAEVSSNAGTDAVAKRPSTQPAGATDNLSIGANPQPSSPAVNDDVEISVEGQRVADALAGTDALADRLDAANPASSIAPADITEDQGDDGLIASFSRSVEQASTTDTDRASELRVDASSSAIEERVTDRNSVVGDAAQVDPSAPAAETEQGFPASNQRASAQIEQAGNDDSSRTEANRTLGQVIDVFA